MSVIDIPTQMLTTCRMTLNSDSWTETMTQDSSHLQEIDNPKHQMHLLCRPQSTNIGTYTQAGQQHQCDLCLLLASQVSSLPAGNIARDKTKSGSWVKCKNGKTCTCGSDHTHTSVRAVGFSLYLSIRSRTTSSWPSWAAKCSMVNTLWFALWSRDCIFGARYWIVLTCPAIAAQWRALHPSCMRETHNNWTHMVDTVQLSWVCMDCATIIEKNSLCGAKSSITNKTDHTEYLHVFTTPTASLLYQGYTGDWINLYICSEIKHIYKSSLLHDCQ